MDKAEARDKIRKVIYDKDPNAEAYLFGSRARGDDKADSDWDILILIDEQEVTNEIEDKFREGLYDLELELGQIISAFIYPNDFWKNQLLYSPLYRAVKNEGVVL